MDNQKKTYAICLGRQLGSGGHAIAKSLAERLNLKFYDRELLYLAAAKSGYSQDLFEKNDEEKGTLHTFFTNFIPFLGSTDFYGNQVDEESLFHILSQTITELAERENCIFVGRCAEYILRAKKEMTSIFICADSEVRMKRLCESKGIKPEAAHKLMLANDKRRASFHDFYSSHQWGVASTYDLCINAGKIGLDKAEDLIIEYINDRFGNL